MRRVPCSIAIIPDGNRRFAKRARLSQADAYVQGIQNVGNAIEWATTRGVNDVTFWALSLENFNKRSQTELHSLFALFEKQLNKALDEAAKRSDGRIHFFGRLDKLPKRLAAKMRELEVKTARNTGIQVNVAVAYSGHDELASAARRIAVDVKNGKLTASKIDESTLQSYLYLPKPTDLIIRTGNVQRTSGFLPWSADYAELYFSPKLWPEFTQRDFDKALQFYTDTERRFGK